MIDRRLADLSRRQGIGRRSALISIDQIGDFLDRNPPRDAWDQRLLPNCQCCGELFDIALNERGVVRCTKHVGRNPCAIDGCKRSFKAHGDGRGFYYSNDETICAQHWRTLIPPGSPERRVYNRFFRRAKKYGWTEQSKLAFWRVWARLLKIARARAAGDVDMDEVNRLFGWAA